MNQRESETSKSDPYGTTQTDGNGSTATSQGEQAPGMLNQASDKAQAMAGQAMGKAQEMAGQATDRAQEMAGQAFQQAREKGPEMMSQAPQQILDTSTGFFHQLETMSPENYYYAAVGTLGATALLLLMGRRSLATFIGLWSALLLNLGLFSRMLHATEEMRDSGRQGRA